MVTPYFVVADCARFWARMVLARAMSRRVTRSVPVLVSCCVAFCMRSPKWARCRSFTSVSRAATSLLRRSAALVISISSGADHAGDERGAQRQLGGSQLERLARQFLGHAHDFVQHLARLDLGDVVLGVALAVAHADLGRLLADRLVREHADPDAAATLDVTGDRATRGFDLAGRQAATVGALEAEIAEGHGIARGRDAGVAAFLLFAVFAASGLQHLFSPLPSAQLLLAGAGRATRLTVDFGASAPGVASAGLSEPSVGATLVAPASRRGPPRPPPPPPGPLRSPPGPPRRSPSRRGPRGPRRSSPSGRGVLSRDGTSLRPRVSPL